MNIGFENEYMEFKKSTGEHKEALQSISAMLNKHGRGEIYFGVDDNGEVTGQDISDSTIRQLVSWISEKIEPGISPTLERLSAGEKAFLRVTFTGFEAPYSADARYYMRVGATNKLMTTAELQDMMLKRAHGATPWDSLPSGRPISEADEAVVREFVELGAETGRIPDSFTNVSGTLARLGMVAADGTLTNAGAVMFCPAPAQYPRMKLGLLANNDKLDILDLRQEGLPLIQLLKRAESFVLSNIRRKFVFGQPGMRRREVPEIPRGAIREAIANALCHRDYLIGSAVEVNVYMDFVEIVNPGLFPEGDTPDRHLDGTAGDFRPRNPNIAQALFRAGMIERYGTGIPRIKRDCDAAGVMFAYRQTVNTTVIRFYRQGAQPDAEQERPPRIEREDVTRDAADRSNDATRIAMQIAHENGRVTKKALVGRAGIGKTKATRTLKELAEKGELEWVGRNTRDPYQYYRLPNDAS